MFSVERADTVGTRIRSDVFRHGLDVNKIRPRPDVLIVRNSTVLMTMECCLIAVVVTILLSVSIEYISTYQHDVLSWSRHNHSINTYHVSSSLGNVCLQTEHHRTSLGHMLLLAPSGLQVYQTPIFRSCRPLKTLLSE